MPNVRGGPLRQFIAKRPHPAFLIGIDDEGNERRVQIVGSSRTKWQDAEDSVSDCTVVRACSADGTLLRTYRRPEDDNDGDTPSSETKASDLISEIPRAISEISRAIAEATDRACTRQGEAYRAAFDSLLTVVRAQTELHQTSMRQVTELQNELGDLARELREQYLAEPEPAKPDALDGATELVKEVVGGALMKKMFDPTPNGGS